jgi:hypothetical protein
LLLFINRLFERWEETALLVFSALASVSAKPNVLFVRLAFQYVAQRWVYKIVWHFRAITYQTVAMFI